MLTERRGLIWETRWGNATGKTNADITIARPCISMTTLMKLRSIWTRPGLINGHIRHYRPRTRYLPSTGNTLRAAAFRHQISRNTCLTVSAIVSFKSSKSARTTSLEETETVERSIGRLTNWVGPAPERLSNMTVKQVVGSRTPPFLFPGFTRNLSKPANSQITGSSPNVCSEHTCFRRERTPRFVWSSLRKQP